MDTILRPRYFIESDSSDREDDSTEQTNISSNSSKITVVPKEYSQCPPTNFEVAEIWNSNNSGNVIVCPTARFLRVKQKEVSSYDLLVLPPKRPKFVIPSNRENMRQKVNPSLGARSTTPPFECVYFENEKKQCKKESSSWSSGSSASANSKRNENASLNYQPMQQPPHEPVPLFRILSEEHQLQQYEMAQKKAFDAVNILFNEEDFSSDKKNNNEFYEFPVTENYVFYMRYMSNNPSLHTNNSRGDVNSNYLPSLLAERLRGPRRIPSRNHRQEGDISPEDRRFRRPVYRLRDSNSPSETRTGNTCRRSTNHNQGNMGIHQTVECSPTSRSHNEKQFCQIKPQSKRRKLNSIECADKREQKPLKSKGADKHYKTDIGRSVRGDRDALGSNNFEELGSYRVRNGVGDQSSPFTKPVSVMFQSLYDDNSSIGTPIRMESQGGFTVIHHPDLQDLRSDSIGVNDFGNGTVKSALVTEQHPPQSNDPKSTDILLSALSVTATSHESSTESPMLPECSPVQIFLNQSPDLPSSSSQFAFSVDGSFMGFTDFCDFGQLQEETIVVNAHEFEQTVDDPKVADFHDLNLVEDESRVIDVTDLIPDSEDFVCMYRNQYNDYNEIETIPIFRAELKTFSSLNLKPEQKTGSPPNGKDSTFGSLAILEDQHPAEELEAQEVLMQPNPRIKTSTSVHSALELSLNQNSSTVEVEDRQTKSDYYIGKEQGLSKSIMMKMYRKHSDPVVTSASGTGNYCSAVKSEAKSERQHSAAPVKPDVCTPTTSPSGMLACIEKTLAVLQNCSKKTDKHSTAKKINPPPKETEPASQSKLRNLFSFTKSNNSQPTPNSTIKTSDLPTAKTEAYLKPIIKKKANPNKLSKIFGSIFKGIFKPKQKSSEDNINQDQENAMPPVPASLSKKVRRLIEHTDSRELYRGRRRKQLQEQIDFQKETLSKYVKSILENEQQSKQLESSTFKRTSYHSPITFFLENPISQSHTETYAQSNNSIENGFDDSANTVPVSVRLSKSDGAIARSVLTRNGGRSSLVLQFPPFLEVLAAIIETTKESIREENKTALEREKEKLKKPLKGILKKN